MEEQQPTTSIAVAAVPTTSNLELTAMQPDEIAQAQISLIDWAKHKISELEAEAVELGEAHKRMVTVKWKPDAIKRMWDKCLKRVEFYKKMISALEHGFIIIPNFPVKVFAIRTDRKKPLKLLSTNSWDSWEQKPEGLSEGEGEYQNPFPQQFERETSTPDKPNLTTYWAEHWKELEFPITMGKPRIIEAVNRAMALKLFDDFGIMPERKKEDPIIVARLKDPRGSKYNPRWITFMVAWHLDTRDL